MTVKLMQSDIDCFEIGNLASGIYLVLNAGEWSAQLECAKMKHFSAGYNESVSAEAEHR